MRYLLVVLLFALLALSYCDEVAEEVAPTPAPETEGAVEDKILNSNGTDVLTTTATFYANHTQTQVQSTKIRVRKSEHEKYQFQPVVIGGVEDASGMWNNSIRFMNAQNDSYYERQLKSPSILLWILISRNPKEKFEYSYSLKRFFETAWKMNIQVAIINTHDIDLIASEEGLQQMVFKGLPINKLPDAVLPRMGAKIDYHSLAVVRQLEKTNVLILNDHNSLEISRDKMHTIQTLATFNLPIPKTMIAKFPIDIDNIEREFNYPLILKRTSGSQGKGVILVRDREHLTSLQDMIDTSQPMIFQQFIANSIGRDIRVIVVGGKVIGAMMRIAAQGFKSNFHQGGYVKPVKISRAVEWLALEAVRLIDLDVAGVDILIDTNSYRICEINSSPGFQGFEMATGVDVPKHIMDFIRLRTGIWGKKSKSKKSHSAIQITVAADHVQPKPVEKQIDVGVDGSQKSIIPMD